jgi:hypothetical protein
MKKPRVEWDGSVVTPSFKLQARVSSMSVELVRKKGPRANGRG